MRRFARLRFLAEMTILIGRGRSRFACQPGDQRPRVPYEDFAARKALVNQ